MEQIPFRIVGIYVNHFEISDSAFIQDKPVEVRTGYEFGVNFNSHSVISNISYEYLQNNSLLLKMALDCVFDIKPDSFKTLINENGDFVLSTYFSQYLATINVGAARGEIHARCESMGSQLKNVILPPINLVEALPQPIVIHLDSIMDDKE